MTPEVLIQFAINSGELYPAHVEGAQKDRPHDWWLRLVKVHTLPLYRRHMNEPYEGISLGDMENVARDLREHYAQHIKEI